MTTVIQTATASLLGAIGALTLAACAAAAPPTSPSPGLDPPATDPPALTCELGVREQGGMTHYESRLTAADAPVTAHYDLIVRGRPRIMVDQSGDVTVARRTTKVLGTLSLSGGYVEGEANLIVSHGSEVMTCPHRFD